MKHFFLSVLFVAAAIVADAQSSLKLPALSPNAKFSQDFATATIDVSYSRPSLRGRKVFGEMIPFGQAWRTGANANTRIKIGEDLEIGGQKVKAGEYTLYTVPGKTEWEVVLSTGTGPIGPEGFAKDLDVARFRIRPAVMETNLQTFTIQITDITFTTCKLELAWERTKIVIPVVSHNSDRIDENIEKTLSHPATLPYFQAANYYFESDKKYDLASKYVNKAIEQDPKAFYMWYLKARIEKKLGHNDDAVAAAKKSMELAKGTANEREYQVNNQKLIDDISKSKPRKQVND
ncbi:MAG: hypothetical protein JWQ38_3427 [Flavipsychrobacter sp.]|nr:hypothetical protein [Flavipsychrobacter sp.]